MAQLVFLGAARPPLRHPASLQPRIAGMAAAAAAAAAELVGAPRLAPALLPELQQYLSLRDQAAMPEVAPASAASARRPASP